jgi:gamma-glutamyltranspeptidase/glutathione hydrolase
MEEILMAAPTVSPARLSAADFPYTSRRMPLLASHGVVATSSPLAAQAGLRMLLNGGNAVDAALATAITLTVVEPTQNGIGSDAFALIWDGSKLHGLNGSGRAPAALTPEVCYKLGLEQMPPRGWPSVTVPGTPRAWRDLHDRFGRLPFASLFEPAIAYARDGYPLSPQVAAAWAGSQRRYPETNLGPEYAGWFETFAPGNRMAQPGDMWTLPDHARTLRAIAESGSDAFYRGKLAEQIAGFAAGTGGYLTPDDLAAHTSTWVEPISVNYKGFDVWELPPNGQGIVALEALGILKGLDITQYARESVESYHLQIEAIKLAFADAQAYVADPELARVPVTGMLDEAYLSKRRALIGDEALQPAAGEPEPGGTVLLCAADESGMMVTFIQSNYLGFGSGIVVPGTGIALQNRGRGFSLKPGHPNLLAPGKRPYHTLMPGFLTRDGKAVGPFGVMGSEMQPQGHVQMIVNQVDYAMNPQASLDAPRWRWTRGKEISAETIVPQQIVDGLTARGHVITTRDGYFGPLFGRGQIIRRLVSGAYLAGSETRSDGCAAGF